MKRRINCRVSQNTCIHDHSLVLDIATRPSFQIQPKSRYCLSIIIFRMIFIWLGPGCYIKNKRMVGCKYSETPCMRNHVGIKNDLSNYLSIWYKCHGLTQHFVLYLGHTNNFAGEKNQNSASNLSPLFFLFYRFSDIKCNLIVPNY